MGRYILEGKDYFGNWHAVSSVGNRSDEFPQDLEPEDYNWYRVKKPNGEYTGEVEFFKVIRRDGLTPRYFIHD